MQIRLDMHKESTKTCFIVYSSREPHIAITLDAIETVLEATGKYDTKRLSIHGIPGHSQYSQLLDFLNRCSLAIIILDGFRPNVIFEYGILVGLRKPCIVLLEQKACIDIQSFMKEPMKKPPVALIDMDKDFSDVKDQMYVRYKYSDPKNLREILTNELKKVEPLVEEAFMKLVFPEKDYIEKEVKESLVTFSELKNSGSKITTDDEIKFRVCVNEIEKASKKYNITLTSFYYYQKIQILVNLKKYEESKKLLDELIKDHSSDVQLLILKAEIFTQQDEKDLAINCLNDAIKIDEKNEYLWHHKAILLEQQGRKDEAAICYKKGLDFNNGCSSIHFHYGLLLLDNDDYQEALLQFNQAIKIRSSESSYHVCKAICLKSLDQKDYAKKALTEALSFDENNANAWYQLGLITDDDTQAIKYFNKALSYEPNHAGALCSRGASLSNIGQLEEACIDLQKAITICKSTNMKGCFTVYDNLSKTKFELAKTGNDKYGGYRLEVISDLGKALTFCDKKSSVSVLNNIGYLYLSLNKISEAKEYLIKAQKQTSVSLSDALVSYNLALCYLLEANYGEANKLFTAALNLSRDMAHNKRKFLCLLIPEVTEIGIKLIERDNADLYEFAKLAIHLVGERFRS